MHWDSRRQVRRQLECEVTTGPFLDRLRQLASEFPVFTRFGTWQQVFDHLLDRLTNPSEKDEILGALIWTAQVEPDPGWNSVLTLAFWPALESIHRQKQKWDKDSELLWSNIYWRFLEVVHGLDVIRRMDSIASRVFNTTLHNLHESYQREWNRQASEINPGPKEYAALCNGLVGEEAADIEGRAEVALQVEHLRRLRSTGVITRTEFRLIWAVDVEGQSLREFAASRGLNPETVKKQRQRALARIRAHLSTQLGI